MNPIQQVDTKQSQLQQIVVFRLGEEEYGLPINQIKEVVLTPTITRMPQTQPYVRGVSNIRGTVIAMLDLEEKFGLRKEAGEVVYKYTLVIESSDYRMGLLVRDVPNTLSISQDTMESFSPSENDAQHSSITGIVKLDKRLIIMIDIFKVINEKETTTMLKSEV